MLSVLVVTAVDAELSALMDVPDMARPDLARPDLARPDMDVLTAVAGGVGPVAAAVSTANALNAAAAGGRPADLVVSVGIGGGFTGRAAIGATVLGTRSVFAGLGAATVDGFLSLSDLGLPGGPDLTSGASPALVNRLAHRLGAVPGTVLTLATMTGTDIRAEQLAATYPEALAEAMEGFGVASAAAAAGVPWLEVRTISNLVGRRDRSAWDLPAAFAALRAVGSAMAELARTGRSAPQ